jgi:hypothetical protein
MITTSLVLEIGHFKKGKYIKWDAFDLEIHTFDNDVECDNLNDLLSGDYEGCNYAELRVYTTGMPFGFLVGTFKRVKLKNNQYRWVLSG